MTYYIITPTEDGSHTLYSEQYKAHYHSLNGAMQESQHIFIKNGFDFYPTKEISILEMGLGTGLNATLTASSAFKEKRKTYYTAVELHPIKGTILEELNYKTILRKDEFNNWRKISNAPWNEETIINESFLITKLHADICKTNLNNSFDLIYYDAFAPDIQPEVWSIDIFEKLFKATNPGGILVTYCSKGIVKQALRHVGYNVKRLEGPPGKRHILRAMKI